MTVICITGVPEGIVCGQLGETAAAADSAYRFRYSGLKLLVHSGDKYFLLPKTWTRHSGVAVVVRDTPDIRVEFSPGGW